ncbi:MAG: prolyl oligopeptidase family serine peptidase [Pirellulales bacterium]|nr:prolyl oligopeptidase family serine peptidase [Pirellulales bacterium]
MQHYLILCPIIMAGLILCPPSSGDDDINREPISQKHFREVDDDHIKRAEIVFREDIVYGRVHGAGLLADIAYPDCGPELNKPLPVILSVHGGRWQGGHKKDNSSIDVKEWATHGFFAMSIDYRLVGSSPAPACYQDLQCAIRFLHAHAKQYNIDADRIFLIGQSAGGHMVSLAATMGDGPFPRTGGWQNASNKVVGAISVAANYDLPSLSWGKIWRPAKGDFQKALQLASPVNHVHKKMVPILIIHSDDDQSVPIANALLMVDALNKCNAPHRFIRYTDAGHMGITDAIVTAALEFIKYPAELPKGGQQ